MAKVSYFLFANLLTVVIKNKLDGAYLGYYLLPVLSLLLGKLAIF